MSRQEGCRPHVVDGVRNCVGKVQVVNRYPWMLALFSPTQQYPSTNSSTSLCVRRQVAGWLCETPVLQAPYTAPTVVPPSRAGQVPVLGPMARTGQGPVLGPMARDGQGPVLGQMARAGQGPVLGPMASNIAPHRHSPTLSSALRRTPTLLRRPPAPTVSVSASSVLYAGTYRARTCSSSTSNRHPPQHIALCPCPNIQARRPAHLIDVPCRASQPPPPL